MDYYNKQLRGIEQLHGVQSQRTPLAPPTPPQPKPTTVSKLGTATDGFRVDSKKQKRHLKQKYIYIYIIYIYYM